MIRKGTEHLTRNLKVDTEKTDFVTIEGKKEILWEIRRTVIN